MRRRMSAVTERAIDQVMRWRAQGVPSYVTRYEAHALTNGAVGEPRTAKNSTRAMARPVPGVTVARTLRVAPTGSVVTPGEIDSPIVVSVGSTSTVTATAVEVVVAPMELVTRAESDAAPAAAGVQSAE